MGRTSNTNQIKPERDRERKQRREYNPTEMGSGQQFTGNISCGRCRTTYVCAFVLQCWERGSTNHFHASAGERHGRTCRLPPRARYGTRSTTDRAKSHEEERAAERARSGKVMGAWHQARTRSGRRAGRYRVGLAMHRRRVSECAGREIDRWMGMGMVVETNLRAGAGGI